MQQLNHTIWQDKLGNSDSFLAAICTTINSQPTNIRAKAISPSKLHFSAFPSIKLQQTPGKLAFILQLQVCNESLCISNQTVRSVRLSITAYQNQWFSDAFYLA